MNWETFYLVCFLAGLMLSFISLLGGMGHFGGHVHVPHVHVPHVGHVHIPHSAGVAHAANAGAGSAASSGPEVPWWNAFSIMIFLCWFGAAGYLLTKYGSFVASVVVVMAAVCGLAGGAMIFMFMTRVLMPHDRELTADETDVVGVVGRVSSPIRAGGTGAIVYQQMGAMRSANARADDGGALGNDEEVFVIRYEKGIAYVKRWEDLDAGSQLSVNSDQKQTTNR